MEVKTIIDYANQEWRTFEEKPFGDVDSLVLSQLTYIHYNGLVGGLLEDKKPVKLWELLKAEHFSEMFTNMLCGEKTKELLFAVVASPRFRNMELNYYDEITDADVQKQFASVTYLLPCNQAYVAFRGTDTSIIGWKEDFNMAFMQEVPSQRAAVRQLEGVAASINMPIMTGGHSKGGNMAVYAGANCNKATFEKIERVYSHDGPGFRKDVIKAEGFKRIEPKVSKTVPEFSLVGMLLQNQADYKVVESEEKLLMQHNPFSWKIGNEDFVYAKDITKDAVMLRDSISGWLAQIDDNSRERFIDVLFETIVTSGITNVTELETDRMKNALAIVDALKEVDTDTRRFVFQTLNILAGQFVENIKDVTRKKRHILIKGKKKTDNQN